MVVGLMRRLGELDAACLAAPANLHLSLYHDPAADFLCGTLSLGRCCGYPSDRHRHADAGEQRLSLVFK
jgi:hypothetical protein